MTSSYDSADVNGVQVAIGGGSVMLQPGNQRHRQRPDASPHVAGITIKENDWVALCRQHEHGLCRWYRVASVGDNHGPTST